MLLLRINFVVHLFSLLMALFQFNFSFLIGILLFSRFLCHVFFFIYCISFYCFFLFFLKFILISSCTFPFLFLPQQLTSSLCLIIGRQFPLVILSILLNVPFLLPFRILPHFFNFLYIYLFLRAPLTTFLIGKFRV
jgi:hypothetical protein